jgi:hypothetical protein
MWTASTDKNGYGRFRFGKMIRAHRFVYKLKHGEFDETKLVLHHCDVPGCCSPEHLWLGTNQDNTNDCKKKGRKPSGDNHPARLHPEYLSRGDKHYSRTNPEKLARGDKNGARTHPEKLNPPRGENHWSKLYPEKVSCGEKNGGSKLTTNEVNEIRNSLDKQRALADRYGVTQQEISRIKTNKRWKIIP